MLISMVLSRSPRVERTLTPAHNEHPDSNYRNIVIQAGVRLDHWTALVMRNLSCHLLQSSSLRSRAVMLGVAYEQHGNLGSCASVRSISRDHGTNLPFRGPNRPRRGRDRQT